MESSGINPSFITLSIEERRKLHGRSASYELAKIAIQQGVDLSKISKEDYAEFAIRNYLAIDSPQLRMAVWQRMATSEKELNQFSEKRVSEINKDADRNFAKFRSYIQDKDMKGDRSIQEGIEIKQGTYRGNHWLYFKINNGKINNSQETHKVYVSIKDLNTLTPERFIQFMVVLRDVKYNGDIKIFQDLSGQGVFLNSQIVIHGSSQVDAELALKVSEEFFGLDIYQKSLGKDEFIEGEKMSYDQILAKKIADAVNPPNTK